MTSDSFFRNQRQQQHTYYRFRFGEAGDVNLYALMAMFYSLGEFMRFTAILATPERDLSELRSEGRSSGLIQDNLNGFVADARVDYLSKRSPVEIVLSIAGGGGIIGAALYGHKLLDVYDKWLDVRRKKSETDLITTANKLLIDELKRLSVSIDPSRLKELGLTVDLRAAGQGLAILDGVEVLKELPASEDEGPPAAP